MLFVTLIAALAACGAFVLAVQDRQVRLKIAARLDHHGGDGHEILRLSVTNKSAFPSSLSFVGVSLKGGVEHQISSTGWYASHLDGSPIPPRVTWEHHYPLRFQGHESNRDRADLVREDLRFFVVRTAQERKRYEVAITGFHPRRSRIGIDRK